MKWLKAHPYLWNGILFALIVLFAFSMRTWHYNTSVEVLDYQMSGKAENVSMFRKLFPRYHQNFAPFTIESAMMFTYAKDVAEGRGVPAVDKRLAGQEDLAPWRQMNMGLEWFLGWGWKIRSLFPYTKPTAEELRYQDNPAMAQWMSAQLRFWASLTTGFIFLWLLALHCSRPLAVFGALLHAVALAAIARSTGQDFVRGEFCIPLYTASLALAYSAYSCGRYWKYILLGVCVFLGFVTWDLCQMLFGIWAMCEILRTALGYPVRKSRYITWGVIAFAVLLNAAFVPFNQTYSLWRSSLLWVALPSLAAAWYLQKAKFTIKWHQAARGIVMFLIPLCLYAGWNHTINTPAYRSNYSHFSEAMAAKLKYKNVKPQDPAKLSYDARILWTPSMHSATWDIATSFFPSFHIGKTMNFMLFRFLLGYLPVTLGVFLILLLTTLLFRMPRQTFLRSFPDNMLPVLFTVGFIFAFALIVRYHEFLILFLCVSLPLLMRDMLRSFRYAPAKVVPQEAYTTIYKKKKLLRFFRGTILTAAVVCLAIETFSSFAGRRRYTGDVAFTDTANVIAWFRTAKEQMQGKIVAANITVGPMLMAYTGTGITMNPQFGLKRIRDATQYYIEALFAENELKLLDYCEKYKADYVLYHCGTLSDHSVNGIRYMANVKNVPAMSPANLMLYRPDRLRWFYQVPLPPEYKNMRTYRVYKVIKQADRKRAAELTLSAMDASLSGRKAEALKLLREALTLDPQLPIARNQYRALTGSRRVPVLTLHGLR